MKTIYPAVKYDVVQTTTDQLESILNGFPYVWDVTQVTLVGNDRWVIIAKCYEQHLDD